jgi:two-component system KDP operon response regulator KdpE
MGAKVLVVDDEPQIRRALRVGLQANGFAVEEAVDAQTALDAAAVHPPDVVILDLGLPDLDGIEVIRQLREWTTVPIIVLSVRGAERDKVAALTQGADDYVTKPFGMEELVARILVTLRHAAHQQPPEPILTFGELRIDLASRVVTLDEDEIHLTPTEYDLLRELAGHAGKVLTHQQLLTRVWGPASADTPQYLRVYINQLRQKLEPDPRRPRYILTEPGVGYRFRADLTTLHPRA